MKCVALDIVSDHRVVVCQTKLKADKVENKRIQVRKTSTKAVEEIRCAIGEIPQTEFTDIDDLALNYNTTLTSLLDKSAPSKTKEIRVRPKVPWFNDFLKPKNRS